MPPRKYSHLPPDLEQDSTKGHQSDDDADETVPLSRKPPYSVSSGTRRDWASAAYSSTAGSRRETTGLEEYKSWRTSQWKPETSMGQAKWWVVVVSAFANMGPAGCLVVSTPHGGLALSLVNMLIALPLSLFGAWLATSALQISGSTTLMSCWRTSIGPRTAWIPNVAICLTCFGCILGFTEFASHLMATVIPINPLPDLWTNPQWFWMTVFAIIPMSFLVLLKDITVMRPFTTLTFASCTIVLAAVITRFADGSYTEHGRFGLIEERESTNWKMSTLPIRESNRQVVLFLCHFNTAKYFRELENPRTSRYVSAIAVSMGATITYCFGIMIFVFLTFGLNTAYITTDNYSIHDDFMNVARFGICVGLLGCISLLFCGMREAAIEMLDSLFPSIVDFTNTVFVQNTMSLVALYGSVAICLTSIASNLFLFDFFRSCFGALLIYSIPPLLYVTSTLKYMSKAKIGVWMRLALLLMGLLGLVSFCMSAYLTIHKEVDTTYIPQHTHVSVDSSQDGTRNDTKISTHNGR